MTPDQTPETPEGSTAFDALRDAQLRALRWTLSLRDAQGRIVCPEHAVEHTGKSACVAISALHWGRRLDDSELIDAAIEQGRRLVANLVREGTSPCHTFRPGRHDPFNCSNSVIDGGACSDALAELAEAEGVSAQDRRAFRAASRLHARTYLRYAVLDKGIPAQRAWGLTGLAGAAALAPESDEEARENEELRGAVDEALRLLDGIQHADGSYPYHPLEWGAEHAGASDVSAFYQSRISAFVLFALERLGRDPTAEPGAPALSRALEFAQALQGPDGIKTGLVEAKPWYWGATYEVASHPFDVFAFARAGRLFGRADWSVAAWRAARAWAEHLDERGAPRSHLPGPGRGRSYQCPLFWAAHACWLARASDDLIASGEDGAGARAAAEMSAGVGAPRVRAFPDAQLVRLEDECVVAWVRGARPAVNVLHGSPHGAGLLRVVRKSDGRELVPRCRLGGAQVAEWSGLAGHSSWKRGWEAGHAALRFSIWLARVHARAGRFGDALLEPLHTLRRGVLAFGHPRVGSAFALAPSLAWDTEGVSLEVVPAHRDGSPAGEARLARRFAVDGRGLRVEERLLSRGSTRALAYRIPAGASEVEDAGDEVAYRLA